MPKASKANKLTIVKLSELPSGVVFHRTLLRPSVYAGKLLELQSKPGSVLRIGDIASQVAQVKKAAEKLGLDLLFARVDGDVLVQVIHLSESQRRLQLLLREPRTVNYLRSQSLELDLEGELHDLAERGMARLDHQGNWKLTPAGLDKIK